MKEMFEELPWYRKIAVLRAAKGWSQKTAGEECLTNAKNYWTWESGRSYPRLASRKAIADAFGLQIEDIFSAKDECVQLIKGGRSK